VRHRGEEKLGEWKMEEGRELREGRGKDFKEEGKRKERTGVDEE